MRFSALALVPIVSLAYVPSAAAAGPTNVPAAESLFRSGKAAMARGDLATACKQLRESQRLDPESGTLLNLAICDERSGRLATALAHLHDVRERLAANDFRLPFVQKQIQALTPRVPRLTLKLSAGGVAGITVTRYGAKVDPSTLGVSLPVDPGTYVYTVHAPAHADARVTMTIKEGENRTLFVAPGPLAPKQETAQQDRGQGQRILALAVGGLGAVGLGIGTYYGFKSKGTYDDAISHCPNGASSCDPYGVQRGRDAHTQATVSTVTFIAGGALLATGAVLYFTAPDGTRAEVSPMVGSRAAGVSLQGVW